MINLVCILVIILLMFIGTWETIRRVRWDLKEDRWVNENERKIIKSDIKDLKEKDLARVDKWQTKTGQVMVALIKELGLEIVWEPEQPERAVMVKKGLPLDPAMYGVCNKKTEPTKKKRR